MTWHTHERNLSKSELLEESQRNNASWACKRVAEENHVQYGFALRPDGTKRIGKLFSLGAQLAATRIQPWLGTFRLDDNTWWYIAVRDGHTILPDGDVVGNEETITKARANHSNFGDWNYIEGDISTIMEMLASSPKSHFPVFSIEREPLAPTTIVFLLMFLTAAGGGYWWLNGLKQGDLDKERIRLLASAKAARERMHSVTKQVINDQDTSFLSLPAPDAWIMACDALIRHSIWDAHGWLVRDITCTKNEAKIVRVRTSHATVSIRPEGDLSANGEMITTRFTPLMALPSADASHEVPDTRLPIVQAREQFFSWSQGQGIKTTLMTASGGPITLPGQEVQSTVSDLANKLDFSFVVDYWPDNLGLNHIPGLRIVSMKFDGNNWLLTGSLYGKKEQ